MPTPEDRLFRYEQVRALTDAITGLAGHPEDSEIDRLQRLEPLAVAVADLVDVTAVAFLLRDASGEVTIGAASSSSARALEELQLRFDEGPCLDAIRTGEAVHVCELAGQQQRWPHFVSAALAAGYMSVAALPLRVEGTVVGGLNLFSSGPAVLAEADAHLAQTAVEAGAGSVLGRRAADRHREQVGHLQVALDSRIVIEQAKGMLASRHGIDVERAFQLLRKSARDGNIKLADAARAVVKPKPARAPLPGATD